MATPPNTTETLRMGQAVLGYIKARYGLTLARQTLHNYANPDKGLNREYLRTASANGVRTTTKADVDRFIHNAFLGTVTPR